MNILAIGAHPDDIEYGCGGTLIKYAAAGHKVFLFVLSDGSFGGDPKVRMAEQEAAREFIQAQEVLWGGLVDTEISDNRQVIVKIEEVVKKIVPDIVFLNYSEDVHQDHRATAFAGISATRYIKEVLFYEVPTTARFEPDVFVDIEDVMDKKITLLQQHASQVDRTRVQNLTILESAISCANFRGFQARVKYAEGFKGLRILREVVR